MKFIKDVSDGNAYAPAVIEVCKDEVHIRSNIRTHDTVDDKNATHTMWIYDDNVLSRGEYYELCALRFEIPDDCWNEGLQDACREARYQRYDGVEKSTRRKIELGIDVDVNNVKLNRILMYKQEVHDTINQAGYPYNVPVWPNEPSL